MKFIVNVTFVMAHEQRRRFLDWMDSSARPLLFPEGGEAVSPRLQTVVEVGGETPGPDHGLSMALQADFTTAEAARVWTDSLLPAALSEYHAKFGPHALFFVTMLESLDLPICL